MHIALLLLLAGISAAWALPTDRCHISRFSQRTLHWALTHCDNVVIDSITVPAGTTLDLSKLKSGSTVSLRGNISFEHSEWKGPLVQISGDNITVDGAGAVLDGNGHLYWLLALYSGHRSVPMMTFYFRDGQGGNGGVLKPKFISVSGVTNSLVRNLKVVRSPVHIFSISHCKNLSMSDVVIDNSQGDDAGAHNTDGFDVGNSDNVDIRRVTVHNQDDCVAVNSGTNLYFGQFTCTGSHGLSIGSVGHGDFDVVKNVTFADSVVQDSANGIRVKAWPSTISGASGQVSDITYTNITLCNISKYGIDVQQNYLNSGPKGQPTDGVSIDNLRLQGVHGEVQPDAHKFNILCGDTSCSNWRFDNVALTGGRSGDVCNHQDPGVNC
ncbi:hypothetical protein RI367_007164 [Sorochytrium milnesiophthora]